MNCLIIGNELVEPPAIFLVKEFARNGPTILPLIREKLVETKNEITVRDIIAVISELHRLNLYDAANDSSLMALATKRVLAMNGQWRSTTLQMLEEIRETPSPK